MDKKSQKARDIGKHGITLNVIVAQCDVHRQLHEEATAGTLRPLFKTLIVND